MTPRWYYLAGFAIGWLFCDSKAHYYLSNRLDRVK